MRNAVIVALLSLSLVQLGGCPIITEGTVPAARVTTSHGDFVVELYVESAPVTVANFLQHALEGFYDGTVFHRAVAESLVHGGAFAPGLSEKATRPAIANESANGLSNVRGTVAMARTDDPDSATSQFFVNLADNSELDDGSDSDGYAVFGRVVEGMDVVDRIAEMPTEQRAGFTDVPVEDVTIANAERVELTLGSITLPAVRVNTSQGAFVIELHPEHAPITVANLLQYVDDGFYDGTVFHRVIPGFVVQGGGLTPDLVQKETRAPIANEAGSGLSNVRATVAMARSSAPDSATSQFFVNLVDNPDLNAGLHRSGYAVFGRVVEGMDVVDQIAELPTGERDGLTDVPLEDVLIEGIQRAQLTLGSITLSAVRVNTSHGSFVIELFPEHVAVTVGNFLQYVDDGFYAGTVIHRVVPGFVVQGGGLAPTWLRKEAGLPIANESDNGLRNVRGTLAMVYAEDPDSATSEFLVNLADHADFDATSDNPGFAVFGRVVEGLDVLDRIAALPTGEWDGLTDVPIEDVILEGIELVNFSTGQLELTPEAEAYLEYEQYQVLNLLRQMLVQFLGLQVMSL